MAYQGLFLTLLIDIDIDGLKGMEKEGPKQKWTKTQLMQDNTTKRRNENIKKFNFTFVLRNDFRLDLNNY